MKKKLLGAMSSIFLSVILGVLCGYLVYSTYSKETEYLVSNNIIYMLEYKEYNDYDSMKLANINEDYTYYEDDSNYYTIIGFVSSKDNLDKILNIYGDVKLVKCYIDNNDFYDIISVYDKKIAETDDEVEIKEILNSMIEYYNNNRVEISKIYN